LALRYKNEPGEALSAYRRALELARQLPLEEVIGTSVRNLVVLLDEQYFDRVPIDLYIAMEEQADRFGMTELACAAARLQGVELLRHGQREAARQALARSLHLAEELGRLQARRELLELIGSSGYGAYTERLFTEARGYLAEGWPRLASAVFNKILTFPLPGQDELRSRIIGIYLDAGQRADAEALAAKAHPES
jgi:hypothetical protein